MSERTFAPAATPPITKVPAATVPPGTGPEGPSPDDVATSTTLPTVIADENVFGFVPDKNIAC